LIVLLFPKKKHASIQSAETENFPFVSVLIPAHNECETLKAKLENALSLDYPPDKMEIIVCSDGSTDATDAIAQRFSDQGVQLVRNVQRRGKAETIRRMLQVATGDLILLTDASARLNRDCLRILVRSFSDPSVGVASARYVVAHDLNEIKAEDHYWSFDVKLKTLEAEKNMLLGVHGAAFMARRKLIPELPTDTINDDFVIPLSIRAQGFCICYVPEAIAMDSPTDSWDTIYHRLIRIAKGNYQMYWRHRRILNPFRGRIALAFGLRKVLKTLGPFFIIGMLLTSTLSAGLHPFIAAFSIASWSALALGFFGLVTKQRTFLPIRMLSYGLMGQIAGLVGLFKHIFHMGGSTWKRAPENEPLDLDMPAVPPTHIILVKRAIDLSFAIIGLGLGLPFLLFVSISILIETGFPVIFRQARVRYDSSGRPTTFTMYKFRTMRTDAETKSGPVWATQDDPRITRLGRFLRRTRLDELPQLFNVLKGEMSMVGPRPERPHFVELLENEIPLYNDRVIRLKPGITGWAQVNVEYDTSVDSVRDKLLFDLTYAAHLYKLPSYLKMEFKILFATLRVMFTKKGAH
jgi:lipopolysaccharide/colanic/teichoic acid biosynthesis glycosyltransferase/glycosyltransferase involved in cell wall biosynthesis